MAIRKVRILIQWHGLLRKLCKIGFDSKDASVYLIPYAVKGKYYYGKNSMPWQQSSVSFDFTDDIFQEQAPHLSIHETGQVQVYAGKEKAGPLFIPSLSSLTGQHVATVCPDAFEALPIFNERLRKVGAEVDQVISAEDGTVSGKLAFYINGRRPEFDAHDCGLVFTLKRSTLARPLFVGVKPIGQPQIATDIQRGVTIIAGWDPLKAQLEKNDFLYIRGE